MQAITRNEVIDVVSGSITPAAVTRCTVLTDPPCSIYTIYTPTTADIINGLFIEALAYRVDAALQLAFVKMIYLSASGRLVYCVVCVLSRDVESESEAPS